MYHLLLPIFSAICGENPQHIWSPGGQPLPCCQRCTGLYIAALMAMALHLWFRPRITKRFLQLHALFLLQLGLFVFPWMPQSPVLRTISGSLFGFGVVAFLWPAIAAGCPTFKVSRFNTHTYAFGLSACLVLTPVIAELGGTIGAFVLMCLVLVGALALAVLASANLVRCLLSLVSTAAKRNTHHATTPIPD